LATGALRVEIEHIPTGGRVVVSSFALAVEWMQERSNEVLGESVARRLTGVNEKCNHVEPPEHREVE